MTHEAHLRAMRSALAEGTLDAGTGARRREGSEDEVTEITPVNLLARGYKEFPGQHDISHERRFFQRRIKDGRGTRYFLEFREWEQPESLRLPGFTYDAALSNDAENGAYIWLTLRADSIEATEDLAERIWQAAGGVYYEAEDAA